MIALDENHIPEPCIDTVRWRIPIDSEFDKWFFSKITTKAHVIFAKPKNQNDPDAPCTFSYEKPSVTYYSSFSRMVMMPSNIIRSVKWASGIDERATKPQFVSQSIDVEYSAHKWNHKSSAFNNGELTFEYIWNPVEHALRTYGIPEDRIDIFRMSAILRRIDLSSNFQLDPRKSGLTVDQVITNMLRYKFRRSELGQSNCDYNGKTGTLKRGNDNSLYTMHFYNKEKEFKVNFKKDRDATDEEREFWDRWHDDPDAKNLLRYEVRYRNRFFSQGLQMGNPQGKAQVEKVIDLSKAHWTSLYKEVFGIYAIKNATVEQNTALAVLKVKCEENRHMHLYWFASSCIERGYKVIKEKTNERTYYRSKKSLLELYDWDITVKGADMVAATLTDEETRVQQEELRVVLTPVPLENFDDMFSQWKAKKIAESAQNPGMYIMSTSAEAGDNQISLLEAFERSLADEQYAVMYPQRRKAV